MARASSSGRGYQGERKRAGEIAAAGILEASLAEPAAEGRIRIDPAAAGAQHEPEGVEDRRPRPIATLGRQDVDDRYPPGRSQRIGDPSQQLEVCVLAEEVANVRDEREVVRRRLAPVDFKSASSTNSYRSSNPAFRTAVRVLLITAVQLHGCDGGTGLARGDGEAPGAAPAPMSSTRSPGCASSSAACSALGGREPRSVGRDSDRGTPHRRLSPRSPAAAGHAVRAGEQAHGLQQLDELVEARMRGPKAAVVAEL